MNTKQLEKFAQAARRQLHEQVAAKLDRVLTTDSADLRAKEETINDLKDEIAASSREAVIERVAYTWFNRFCALRYMDVNHYTRVGVVSPGTSPTGEALTQPEILQEAKAGVIDPRFERTVDAQAVAELLSGRRPAADPQQDSMWVASSRAVSGVVDSSAQAGRSSGPVSHQWCSFIPS